MPAAVWKRRKGDGDSKSPGSETHLVWSSSVYGQRNVVSIVSVSPEGGARALQTVEVVKESFLIIPFVSDFSLRFKFYLFLNVSKV